MCREEDLSAKPPPVDLEMTRKSLGRAIPLQVGIMVNSEKKGREARFIYGRWDDGMRLRVSLTSCTLILMCPATLQPRRRDPQIWRARPDSHPVPVHTPCLRTGCTAAFSRTDELSFAVLREQTVAALVERKDNDRDRVRAEASLCASVCAPTPSARDAIDYRAFLFCKLPLKTRQTSQMRTNQINRAQVIA